MGHIYLHEWDTLALSYGIAGGEIPTGRIQETVQAEKAKVPGRTKDRDAER
jgi:hypothetical protein